MNIDLQSVIEAVFTPGPLTAGIPVQGVQQLAVQEGVETEAYQDEFGNWTIGVGHTPAYAGEVWTVDQCFRQLFVDIHDRAMGPVAAHLPWATSLSKPRWWVLVNMAFNMGIGNLLDFTATLAAFKAGDWHGALVGMEESAWYSQVRTRARTLMYQAYFDEWVLGYLSEDQDAKLRAVYG